LPHNVANLLFAVRNGKITASEFSATVDKLHPADQGRVIHLLIREYKSRSNAACFLNDLSPSLTTVRDGRVSR
jgi:hypothetical protein